MLLIPIERLLPRVARQPFRKGGTIAISVALCMLFITFIDFHFLQGWLIDMGLTIKFASLSRWAITDWPLFGFQHAVA